MVSDSDVVLERRVVLERNVFLKSDVPCNTCDARRQRGDGHQSNES